MGYACPVCGDPQADGEHLANHLAFTAMLGDDDHEAWLDDHAPGWGETDPADLASRVVDHADETEYPQVFEDTTDSGDHHTHDHSSHDRFHDHSHGHEDDPERDAADVLAEARELTRKRRDAVDDGEDEGSRTVGTERGDEGRDGNAKEGTDETESS